MNAIKSESSSTHSAEAIDNSPGRHRQEEGYGSREKRVYLVFMYHGGSMPHDIGKVLQEQHSIKITIR